jgi:TolB-like protein/Tfp pilus assembly protein PilF
MLEPMPSGELQIEAVRLQLERVLASPGFIRNERLSRFLRFVVDQQLEGQGSVLKESLIAIEVFGRKPDYDPKRDSIVRREAALLRSRLVEFYASQGRSDAVVIELPKGSYIPVFRIAEGSQPPRRRIWLRVAFAVVLVAVVAGAGWWWLERTHSNVVIAVLPLENLGGDPANNDFADGLTDEIISNLSGIEGLDVRSRTSSFAFKGNALNVREAGQQLGADYLLEGSVLRAGNKLRVNTQLVRVHDDFALWSGSFDREMSDIFAIQDEISHGIVNQLRLSIGRGRRRYETSVEAYDLYLRARAVPMPGLSSPADAIKLFEQAIAKDPDFAPAYAGMGTAYAIRSVNFPVNHPTDELFKMRAAAEKAIQLDPLLGEAYDALGMAYAREGQWEQAERSFRRAIQLDRNRSNTYIDYALWLLRVLGRNDEALRQLRIAERADPLSALVQRSLADGLIAVGRYDEAAQHCLKLPKSVDGRNRFLARCRLGQGRIGEAIQILSEDTALPRNPQDLGFLGYAYARSGRREEAERMANAAEYPNEQALIFAGLGDKERTVAALDRMAARGAQRVGEYLNLPELALLRGDPQAKALRKKIGLPE